MSTTYGKAAPYWLKKWFLSDSHREALDTIPAGMTALDVGCGGGRVALYLAARDVRASGLDSDETLIQNLQAEHPTIEWLHGDAEDGTIWPASDWIVSNVCIRKDQCRLEKLFPHLSGKKLVLRVQGSRDLAGFVDSTPCYSQEELRQMLPDCQMTVESYQQRFTSGKYLRESIAKIGMTPGPKANGEKPINANREYILLCRS